MLSLSLLFRLFIRRPVTWRRLRMLRRLPLLLLLLKLFPSEAVGVVVATDGARLYGAALADRGEISGDDDVGDVPARDDPILLLLYILLDVVTLAAAALISSGNVNPISLFLIRLCCVSTDLLLTLSTLITGDVIVVSFTSVAAAVAVVTGLELTGLP
ncbi:hypothetical protein PF008_g19888 [Phytophthora fragariae]|uniref:Ion transport domain-containing protein n=1 Tax=Phytophthora fragariae TaxID=53985 RepID=A0A6G0R134_9STRA|nr:hypothetical protein PF008_g19888 [Phytophthora fragariae]